MEDNLSKFAAAANRVNGERPGWLKRAPEELTASVLKQCIVQYIRKDQWRGCGGYAGSDVDSEGEEQEEEMGVPTYKQTLIKAESQRDFLYFGMRLGKIEAGNKFVQEAMSESGDWMLQGRKLAILGYITDPEQKDGLERLSLWGRLFE